jgi:magnesium-transporting ATPase (P-type)
MAFAGSAVANGSGTGIVTATGMQTEIGRIQSDIQARRRFRLFSRIFFRGGATVRVGKGQGVGRPSAAGRRPPRALSAPARAVHRN